MSTDHQNIIKIAITGPESTGKSTLSERLANHYKTTWVPEYAREYINKLNRPYHYRDLVDIANGQLEEEKKKLKYTNRYLFYDTDFLVLKIWSEYKFGKVDPFILNEYNRENYDLYLLLNIDLPWSFDPQREHPDKRQFFFRWFEKELQAKKVSYQIINGNMEERFRMAIKFIEQAFGER